MSDIYGPNNFTEMGYVFSQDAEGWRWTFVDPVEGSDEFGPHFATRAEAIRSAIANWDETGNVDTGDAPGSLKARLSELLAEPVAPEVQELIKLGRSFRAQNNTLISGIIFDAVRSLGIEPDAL